MKHFPLLAATLAIGMAGAASANTIVFGDALADLTYDGFGETITNGTLGLDFIGGPSGGPFANASDGIADLVITGSTVSVRDFGGLTNLSFLGVQFGGFATITNGINSEIATFTHGDAVGTSASYDYSSGFIDVAQTLAVGETGIFGFRMVVAETPGPLGGPTGFDPNGDTDIGEASITECLLLPETCTFSARETYFGWIQITRGSVTPGYIGVNFAPDQAAVVNIPASIPLPAGGLLLIGGLGSLTLMRRRAAS